MREIIFDTETTGLDPKGGDRLVEIGCLELVNHIPTGRTYHVYINPERPVPVEAINVHGLDDKFLSDKPVFAAVAKDFAEFIGDATLIAHNASFDIGFINAEFARVGAPPVPDERVVDTLILARRKHPGQQNSLDALCSRYQIDTSRRVFHGALLDAELLAEVYTELTGGRQAALLLGAETETPSIAAGHIRPLVTRERPVPRIFVLHQEVVAVHLAAVNALGDKAIWKTYLSA